METDAIPFETENTVPVCSFPKQIKNLKRKHKNDSSKNNINTIQKNSLFYDVRDDRKRIAVIFNQHKFDDKLELKERTGTDEDCKRINESLEKLKFKVTALQDPTVLDIDSKIREVAAMTREEVSCVVVVVMTHGGANGKLYAKDASYSEEDLFHPFKDAHALVGVPKLFIIQACRGPKNDEGYIAVDGPEQTEMNEYYTVPTMADMLWMYSSFKDHKSWRNEKIGAFFIQTLCDVLNKDATKLDILQVLTQVNCVVALKFSTWDGKKQMPQVNFTFTKILSFKPISE